MEVFRMNRWNSPNGFLPDDVIIQILCKLPVKSLFRFKCVCKFWCRLSSDKHFINLYYRESSKNPILLLEILDTLKIRSNFFCIDSFGQVSDVSFGFLNDTVKIRASCNGLLCCTSIRNRGKYYVCNPMTREFRLLPRTRERPFTRCQPDYEATLVGLAFDATSWEFKVVLAGFFRPFGHKPHDQLVCLVYDSKTNKWHRFVSFQSDEEFTHTNRNQVVFSSGALHWFTHTCSYVLALDVQDEVWRKISLPDELLMRKPGCAIYLLELDGTVSIIQMSRDWMGIWALKDYAREQWVLEDKVNLKCIEGFAAHAFPISQTKDVVLLGTQKKILSYGRKDKVWREIYDSKEAFAYPLWFSAYPFRSTLFPCGGQGEENT